MRIARAKALGAVVLVAALVSPEHGARADAGGTLDRSFGRNGTAVVDLPGPDGPSDAAVQRDGKIVMAGFAGEPSKAAVVRLTRDGKRDRGFGRRGVVYVEPETIGAGVASESSGWAVDVGRDGSIVLGAVILAPHLDPIGCCYEPVSWIGARLVLVKLRPDGRLDPAFGVGGATSIPLQMVIGPRVIAVPLEVKVLPDGSILVLTVYGGSWVSVVLPFFAGLGAFPNAPVVMKFTSEGLPDPTFGVGALAPVATPSVASWGGVLLFHVEAHWHVGVSGLEVDREGRILVGATLYDTLRATLAHVVGTRGGSDWLIARYLPSGQPDPTFGTAGIVRHDFGESFGDYLFGIKVQRDGRIIAYGEADGSAAMLRLNQDGTIDRGFADRGEVRSRIEPSYIWDVVIEPNGGILAALYRKGQGPTLTLGGSSFATEPTGVGTDPGGRQAGAPGSSSGSIPGIRAGAATSSAASSEARPASWLMAGMTSPTDRTASAPSRSGGEPEPPRGHRGVRERTGGAKGG